MDRGIWRATAQRVAKSQAWLSKQIYFRVFLRFPMNGYFGCLLFFYTFKKCCGGHLSNMPLLFSHSVVSGFYVISIDCSPPSSSVHAVFQALNYWSVLPFPSPGDLPGPAIKPVSPTLASGFFMTELLGILRNLMHKCKICSRTALFSRNTMWITQIFLVVTLKTKTKQMQLILIMHFI